MWLLPRVQQKSLGHHWSVSPLQGLCVTEEVPETMVGLLWVPGLLELPGTAVLNSRGTAGVRGARGAVILLWWDGGTRTWLLTDREHEERKDAHHVPQTHVPEHHGLLGQWRRLGLGRGRAGLWVKRESSEPGTGQQAGMGVSKDSAHTFSNPQNVSDIHNQHPRPQKVPDLD